MKKIIATGLCLMMLATAGFAESFVSVYEEVKSDFPEFSERLISAGASESDIEAFLDDLGDEVQSGGSLTEDNFEEKMYESLKEVLFVDGNMALIQEEHFDFTVALLFEFTDEIEQTLDTKRLSGDLEDLADAVKSALLEDEPTSGGSAPPPSEPVVMPPADDSSMTGEDLTSSDLLEHIEEMDSPVQLTLDFTQTEEIVLPKLQGAFEKLETLVLETEEGDIFLKEQTLMEGLDALPLTFSLEEQERGSFEIGLTVNGFSVKRFQRPITIALDYALEQEQSPESLTVVCPREDGTFENLGGVYRDGQIIFKTNHFSSFQVVNMEKKFPDLESASYAAHKIEFLASKGVISGKGDGTFDPEASITRAETAALVARLFMLENDTIHAPFDDIAEGKWYTKDVLAAFKAGFIAGRGDGTFDPLGEITRQEVIAILSRALVREGYESVDYDSVPKRFREDQISEWAKADIGLAIESGLMRDLPEESLIPIGTATRAEVANMLYEMMDEIY